MGYLTTERDKANTRLLRMLIGAVSAVALFWLAVPANGEMRKFFLASGAVFAVISLASLLQLMGRRKT